jgi:hypothetical protein
VRHLADDLFARGRDDFDHLELSGATHFPTDVELLERLHRQLLRKAPIENACTVVAPKSHHPAQVWPARSTDAQNERRGEQHPPGDLPSSAPSPLAAPSAGTDPARADPELAPRSAGALEEARGTSPTVNFAFDAFSYDTDTGAPVLAAALAFRVFLFQVRTSACS